MTLQTTSPIVSLRMTASFTDMEDLVHGVLDGRIVLDPPYQRASVWTDDQRMALMRSWLMGLPVGAITLNNRMGRAWLATDPQCRTTYAVIDGKQRVSTAIAWETDNLAIPASWLPADWIATKTMHPEAGVVAGVLTDDGPYVHVEDLTKTGRRKVSSRMMISICKADLPSVTAEAQLFLLLNGTGTTQTAQDMARAATVAAGRQYFERVETN